jgi:hypothetical protein
MTSPIESLAVEVFDIIASSLDLVAFQHLRLTSRQLHLLSLSPFAKRYFSRLSTKLGSPSLDRLLAISKHGYFSGIVVQLDIKLQTHRDYEILTNIQKVGIFPPPKRFPVVPGIKQEHVSGEATLYDDVSGRNANYPACITERLTRSLGNLKMLKSINLRTHHAEPVDWQALPIPEADTLFRTRCFEAVFDAVLKSGIQLDEFGMAKQAKTTKALNLAYPALQCPVLSLRHCFEHLHSLTLAVVTASNGDAGSPGWERGITQFIACAPSLKKLTLSLDRPALVSDHSATIIRSLAALHWPLLTTLHLLNCALHEADLVAFLSAHASSITSINLSGVRLLTWNWETFWDSLKGLDQLRRVRLELRRVGIARLHWDPSEMQFLWRNRRKRKFVIDSDRARRPMCELLDDLVAAVRRERAVRGADFGN